jgi:hypothetical protein
MPRFTPCSIPSARHFDPFQAKRGARLSINRGLLLMNRISPRRALAQAANTISLRRLFLLPGDRELRSRARTPCGRFLIIHSLAFSSDSDPRRLSWSRPSACNCDRAFLPLTLHDCCNCFKSNEELLTNLSVSGSSEYESKRITRSKKACLHVGRDENRTTFISTK